MTEEDDSQSPEEAQPETPDSVPASTDAGAEEPAPPWEADLDEYPVRSPSDDPRWAGCIVWTWVVFAVASLIFIIVLIILGVFYD